MKGIIISCKNFFFFVENLLCATFYQIYAIKLSHPSFERHGAYPKKRKKIINFVVVEFKNFF